MKPNTSDGEGARGPLEYVYDTEIDPLLSQIFSICRREGIVMVAAFKMDDGEGYAIAAAGNRAGRMARAEAILLDGPDDVVGPK